MRSTHSTSSAARKRARQDQQPQPAEIQGSRAAALLRRVVAWEWDAAADRIAASSSLELVYGVKTIENVSRGLTLVHAEDHDRHETLVLDAVDRGRGYASSFRIIRPDKAVVWIDERAEAISHRSPEPPELIGLAFDASVRHEGEAPSAMLRALDALEEFGDALLSAHASARRHEPRAQREIAGRWVTEATRAFEQLAGTVEGGTPDAATTIRAATGALSVNGRTQAPSSGR